MTSGVVRDRRVETKKADDRANQALRLAQSQPEEGSQRQRRQDREWRITRLASAGCPRCGLPSCNRLVSKPHRQTPALPQAGVIRRPVGHFAFLLRDMVASCSVGLERHGRIRIGTRAAYYLNRTHPPIPDPCNNAPDAL